MSDELIDDDAKNLVDDLEQIDNRFGADLRTSVLDQQTDTLSIY